MGVFRTIKRALRPCTRLIIHAFILTLPITFFPLLAGLDGGITFHLWYHNQIYSNSMSLKLENDMRSFVNYFDMPSSGLSIHDYFDSRGPFHIPKIDSFGWTRSMGFVQPLEMDPDVGVDSLAGLEGLVRHEHDGCKNNDGEKPGRYWVWVTSLPEFMPTAFDEAFDEVLRKAYVRPLPGGQDVDIVHLDCASSGFLCGVWGVKSGALMSFEVGERTLAELDAQAELEADEAEGSDEGAWLDGLINTNWTYSAPRNTLFPVTVRVIELPLEDEYAANLLPRGTLPTPELQLKALMLDPDPSELLSHWDEHRSIIQTFRRFNDHHDTLTERRGTWRYYYVEADKWYSDTILEPIFGKEFLGPHSYLAVVQDITFTIVIALAEIVRLPLHFAWEVYAWYFGLGYDGEPVDQGVPLDTAGQGEANMMDDMMAGFWESLAKNLSAEESEKLGRAAVTSSGEPTR